MLSDKRFSLLMDSFGQQNFVSNGVSLPPRRGACADGNTVMRVNKTCPPERVINRLVSLFCDKKILAAVNRGF